MNTFDSLPHSRSGTSLSTFEKHLKGKEMPPYGLWQEMQYKISDVQKAKQEALRTFIGKIRGWGATTNKEKNEIFRKQVLDYVEECFGRME